MNKEMIDVLRKLVTNGIQRCASDVPLDEYEDALRASIELAERGNEYRSIAESFRDGFFDGGYSCPECGSWVTNELPLEERQCFKSCLVGKWFRKEIEAPTWEAFKKVVGEK